jgi:tetratricopeptide (TPR) repeat protein
MKTLKPINPQQTQGTGGSLQTSEKKKNKNGGRSKQDKEKVVDMDPDQASDGPDRKQKTVMSVALENALTHCREGMSDVQKSYILQKEAKILYETGNIMGSLDVISYAINLNHVVPFFLLRAMCYKSLQRWTDAYFEYCFCIQIEPEVGSHYSLRAQCLAKLKRLEMACEDLTHACRLDSHPNNYITRGNLYADMGKYDLAVDDLDKALRIIEKEEMSGELKSLVSYHILKYQSTPKH